MCIQCNVCTCEYMYIALMDVAVVEIKDYFVVYFDSVATFEALYHQTCTKVGTHLYNT